MSEPCAVRSSTRPGIVSVYSFTQLVCDRVCCTDTCVRERATETSGIRRFSGIARSGFDRAVSSAPLVFSWRTQGFPQLRRYRLVSNRSTSRQSIARHRAQLGPLPAPRPHE
jgi:hypothetical protein